MSTGAEGSGSRKRKLSIDCAIPPMHNFSGDIQKFVLFGDSLTQWGSRKGGIHNLLSNHFVRRLDVVNRGFSGYNTKWMLPILKRVFPQESEGDFGMTRLVYIFLGANDLSNPAQDAKLTHVPLNEYGQNLKTIYNHITSHCPKANVFFITAPPVVESWRKDFQLANGAKLSEGWVVDRNNYDAKRYADRCKKVAAELDAPCIDLYTHMFEKREEYLSIDGLHLNAKGYHVIYEHIVETIRKNWPELNVEPAVAPGKSFRHAGECNPVPKCNLEAGANPEFLDFANDQCVSALPFFFPDCEDYKGKQIIEGQPGSEGQGTWHLEAEVRSPRFGRRHGDPLSPGKVVRCPPPPPAE